MDPNSILFIRVLRCYSCRPLNEKFELKRRAIGGEVVRAYHGTSPDAAASIAIEGQRSLVKASEEYTMSSFFECIL